MMKKIFSFSFLTAILLIVGSCKKDSDSEKDSALEFDFAQPAAFAAGETKEIPYTAVGNIVDIRFLDIPNGWSLTANRAESKLTVTAPATFDNSNRAGEATILVSDNLQHTLTRTVTLTAEDENKNDDENDDDDNGDDDDDDNDDNGDDNVTDATAITVEGYSGNSIAVYYTDDTYGNITKNAAGIFAVPRSSKVIHHIDLDEYTVFVGRRADGSAIPLKLRNGNLILRDAVDGFIPIGTYSEFQLIDDSRTSLAESYKQETDLDLLDLEWMPIGGNSNVPFTGTFDGDSHTVANLKITGNYGNAGLFGYINDAHLRNIHIISGSVSGNWHVGSICGLVQSSSFSSSSISACSNTASVSGKDIVGGIFGNAYASSASASSLLVTACYNAGPVSGNSCVGGVCGSVSSFASFSVTACYNTGPVSGNSYAGGVCGIVSTPYSSSSSSIIACYNTGSVSGDGSVGSVCGTVSSQYSVITACYWKDVSNDDASYGTGNAVPNSLPSNEGTYIFGTAAWPATATHTQWGIGDGSGDGKYWKSLGGWNGGNPEYPKLFFEEL